MNKTSINTAGATFKSYATGFILSIILTAIPFALVMQNVLARQTTVVAISIAAIVQVLVHLRYFLHLDASSKARWSALSLLFAVWIMLFIVGGTIWIMNNLTYRLM